MAVVPTPSLWIESARLLLRPLQLDDADAVLAAAKESHEGLQRWYSGPLTKRDVTQADVERNIGNFLHMWDERSFFHCGVFEKSTGGFVGVGSLHHLDWSVPQGLMGYWTRTSAQGKGYATEVAQIMTRVGFDQLSLKRLDIRCATDNKASSAVPKKLDYHFVELCEDEGRTMALVHESGNRILRSL